MSTGNRKAELGAATRATLIDTARTLFANGYEAVSTPAIAAAAGVTRGALYHHFTDKRALFEAVVERVAADLVNRIHAAATKQEADPLAAVIAGCRAFVAACQDIETRQIFLIDAPTVLGWSTWRAIDARHGLGSLKEGLAACAATGLLSPDDIDAVAHLISGALNEAVFLLADRPSDPQLAANLDAATVRMIRGLLSPAGADA